MHGRPEIQDIPRALRQTLEKAKPEYTALVRQTRWGEGPIYICACGGSNCVSLVGGYAFESLLGLPVVARQATVFQNYSSSLLKPRSILLVVSASGDAPEALDLARLARSRGATLLAMTSNPAGPLAKSAQGVILTGAELPDDTPATAVCQHAALTYLAWVAAQTLKRPSTALTSLEGEFEKLPRHAEWSFIHLADAIRSLASRLRNRPVVWVVGGGFYHPAALQGAKRIRELAKLHAVGIEAAEFRGRVRAAASSEDAVLFLSGSHSKFKREIHQSVAQARMERMGVLSVTDPDDRELAGRSDLAVLAPCLSELVGSTLVLILVEWLAVEAAHQAGQEQMSK
jgi:glucosamine--fructose-6-phosphate aminotransferase (isomerizing)